MMMTMTMAASALMMILPICSGDADNNDGNDTDDDDNVYDNDDDDDNVYDNMMMMTPGGRRRDDSRCDRCSNKYDQQPQSNGSPTGITYLMMTMMMMIEDTMTNISFFPDDWYDTWGRRDAKYGSC